MTKIGNFLCTKVYEFLDQKFTLIEAKNNVLNLISKQLKSENYYSDMEKFKKEFLQTMITETRKIKALDEDTSKIISDEFWKIFRDNYDNLIFFPENFYQISFRKAEEDREAEKDFSNVIDFYLLENDGAPWDMPIETYAIEFTEDVKKDIFNIVTNGFVNPNFTLTDYQYLYK
jgi:hypothetical protein